MGDQAARQPERRGRRRLTRGPDRGPDTSRNLAAGLRETLQLEVLDRARSTLRAAGIPSVAFRGAALIEDGVWPEPGTRTLGDVDLLVPLEQRRDAVRTLSADGFVPWVHRVDDPAPLWLDAVTLSGPAPLPGMELTLDLHWRISRGHLRFGVPGLEGELPDAGWHAARPEPHLVHLVEHFLRHHRVDPHPVALEDVARLAPRIGDWGEVVHLARSGPLRHGTAAVLEAVRRSEFAPGSTEPTAGEGAIPRDVPSRIAPLDPRLVHGFDPARVVAAPVRPGRLPGLRERMRWAGGVIPGTAQMAAAAVPDRAWLASRYPGTPAPLRLPKLWIQALGWMAGLARSPVSGNQEFEPLPGSRGPD